MVKNMFGQFLIDLEIVDEAAVYEALNIQKSQKIPIGKIAIRDRVLTVKQVINILNAQAEIEIHAHLQIPFGKIAIERGYLDEPQVKGLLAIQKKIVQPIGEILVKMKKIDRDVLEKMLKEFKEVMSK